MTSPRKPEIADTGHPSIAILAVPYVLMFVVAAATPDAEFRSNQGDVGLYLEKAQALVSGQIPYRDFSLEYPPVALVPMVVPYLLWPFGNIDLDIYKWLFAGWEATLLVVLGLLVTRIARLGGDMASAATVGDAFGGQVRERVLDTGIRFVLLCFGAALALAWRFDLFPAVLAMAALWAALEGRLGTAGVMVGLGVLAKVFPIAILPAIAVAWLVRRDIEGVQRLVLTALATVLLGLVPFVILAGPDALAFVGYQVTRGLQIESLGGGLVVLEGLLGGRHVELSHQFSAVHVTGPLASTLLAVLLPVTVAAFGALAWIGWRRVRRELEALGEVLPSTIVALAAASLLLLIATNKVFSIQYVVWVLPFAALLSWRLFAVAIVLVGLTMPIHPLLYGGLVAQEALPIVLLNLRNALLVVLLVGLVHELWRAPAIGAVGQDRQDEEDREDGEGLARPAGLEPTTFRSAT